MVNFKSVEYASRKDGVRLLVLGAVHGNEVCGTAAIHKLMGELDRGDVALSAGCLTLVPITNALAHARGTRSGDRNLNRGLRPTTAPADNEDHIANWLCPLLARHDVLLDLHSFRGGDKPFVFIGPPNNDGAIEPFRFAAEEEDLAAHLGVRRVVDGWLSTYAGGVARRRGQAAVSAPDINDAFYGIGTTEYMRSVGGWGMTLECGFHEDASAEHVAYRAIRNALAHLGLTDEDQPQPVAGMECLQLCEVIDRQDAGDRFVQPWTSFEPVMQGQVIAERANGEKVVSPFDGCIVFPNPDAALGSEWFYLARSSRRL
ncbi:succinylglutamate desuccinylase/aspartoacylase family protein [Ectopseudomonas composti]